MSEGMEAVALEEVVEERREEEQRHVEENNEEETGPVRSHRKKKKCQLSYEALMWTIFVLFATWAVADRFVGPLFFNNPHGGFLPPPCFENSLCLNSPPMPTNVSLSVTVFDVYQRATGRLFVAVTPFLIILQCKTTENFFAEHHPSWLKIGDLRTTNNRIHYMMGLLFLAIPMYIHMWIFFVPLMAGVPFRFLAAGEEAPEHALDPFVDSNGHMFILAEDLLRLPLAIICFMILLPLSVGNWCRRKGWNTSHWMHIIAATVYTMDFLRGNHPHAQMWTAPLVIYYMLDRLVGIYWYRSGKGTIIHHLNLDGDYCVVFMYAPNQARRRGIGSLYYMAEVGRKGYGRFAHAFTAFQNRAGTPLIPAWTAAGRTTSNLHKFFLEETEVDAYGKSFRRLSRSISVKTTAKVNVADDFQEGTPEAEVVTADTGDRVFFSNWDFAFIMQVHEENHKPSFTSNVRDMDAGASLNYYGPYYSEYNTLNDFTKLNPIILIATGAGANYLLDFYSKMVSEEDCTLQNPVQVYYSTSSLGLFQFVTDYLCEKEMANWSVTAHLTQHEGDLEYAEEDERQHNRRMQLGRFSLEETIKKAPSDAHVYFCGNPDIQWEAELLCVKYNLTYFPGNRFSPSGARELKYVKRFDGKGGRLKCRCTKMCCCLHY